jgi:hypothetical protein
MFRSHQTTIFNCYQVLQEKGINLKLTVMKNHIFEDDHIFFKNCLRMQGIRRY